MRRSIQVAFVACVVLVVAGGAIGGGAIGGGGGGGFLPLNSNGPLTSGLCVKTTDGSVFLAMPDNDTPSGSTCGASSLSWWQIGNSTLGAQVRGRTTGQLDASGSRVSISGVVGSEWMLVDVDTDSVSVTSSGTGIMSVAVPLKNLSPNHSGRVYIDDEAEVTGALRAASIRATSTTTSGTRATCNAPNVGMQTMYDDGNGRISLCVCEQTGSGTYAWGAATSSGSC